MLSLLHASLTILTTPLLCQMLHSQQLSRIINQLMEETIDTGSQDQSMIRFSALRTKFQTMNIKLFNINKEKLIPLMEAKDHMVIFICMENQQVVTHGHMKISP